MYLFFVLTALFRTVYCDLNKLNDYCHPNQKLCEIPSVHALCSYSDSELSEECLPYVNEPLSGEEKIYILSLHNKLRNLVATGNEKNQFGSLPTASNMLKLHWDVELETTAERWAERCLNATISDGYDDCKDKTRYNVAQNVGTIGSKGIVAEKRIFRIFHAWYSKNKLFKLSSVDNYLPSDEGEEVKEYTNLIWADSDAMGCSRVVLLNNISGIQGEQGMVPWTFERIICNYVPGGNIPGKPVYKRGAPCSDCPMGMKCTTEFPGLCTSNDTEVEDNAMNMTEIFSTDAVPQEDGKALETDATSAEETSKSFLSDIELLAGEAEETETEMTSRYSTLSTSSWIPANDGRSTTTETSKLFVKTGIYFNGRCHCPDISRFGPGANKKLPAEISQKFNNQVYSSRENARESGVQEGKSIPKLKQGDRCYCKVLASKGSIEPSPSRFLFCIYVFYIIKAFCYKQ